MSGFIKGDRLQSSIFRSTGKKDRDFVGSNPEAHLSMGPHYCQLSQIIVPIRSVRQPHISSFFIHLHYFNIKKKVYI